MRIIRLLHVMGFGILEGLSIKPGKTSLEDYFDNAKYGIAHTRWALTHSVPFLLEKSKRNIPTYLLDVPVFIVGNGPSLDYLIEVLREEKERVVIVSCGTALQALYQNGITPDYHAEIETNRSTFDWLTRINDKSYLKKIKGRETLKWKLYVLSGCQCK